MGGIPFRIFIQIGAYELIPKKRNDDWSKLTQQDISREIEGQSYQKTWEAW